MNDEEYVRELLAILTNPSPTGIDPADPYGQADDGIDRYDGFGRDVRVTSAAVVPGEHGAQVEIGFVIDLPDDTELTEVPAEGSVRLPVAAEWRTASNYDDPADYAPRVAHGVMMRVHSHVTTYRRWAVLLEHLGHEGAVTESSPGRIEVFLDADQETLTVIVTPEQWEQVVLRHVGPQPSDYFTDLLGPRDTDELFLVFWDGDLERSVREKLPPVRPHVTVDVVPGGAWFAYTPSQDLHTDQGHP